METTKIKYNDKRYESNTYQGFIGWDDMKSFRKNYCISCVSQPSCPTSSRVLSAINNQQSYWNDNCLIALRRIKSEAGLPAKVIACSDFKIKS
jgi:hypothetical protein